MRMESKIMAVMVMAMSSCRIRVLDSSPARAGPLAPFVDLGRRKDKSNNRHVLFEYIDADPILPGCGGPTQGREAIRPVEPDPNREGCHRRTATRAPPPKGER
jgi:hypothetical protein